MKIKVAGMRGLSILALPLVAVLCAYSSADALDGQIQISQPSAFPFNVTVSGSYVLTSNLIVTTCSDAIDIHVPNVTINLNGFRIRGAGCSNAGDGINGLISSAGGSLVTIYNGDVSNFGVDGIALAHSSTVYGVRAFGNGRHGIFCTDGCQIFDNIANNNGFEGIGIAGSGRVSDNVAQFNGKNGIHVFDFSLVLENTASHNGASGILADQDSTGGSLVRDNNACGNGTGLTCNSPNTGYSGNQFTCAIPSNPGDPNGINVNGVCTNLGHNF